MKRRTANRTKSSRANKEMRIKAMGSRSAGAGMGSPSRKRQLTYLQAICFVIGAIFFFSGSAIAYFVASEDLKQNSGGQGTGPLEK